MLVLLYAPMLMAQESVVLQLKWFHQFQFAGFYAAKEQGYYADAGFDDVIKQRDVKTTTMSDVIEGRADFGISDSSIVAGRLNGMPLVIASTIFQTSPFVFMSLKDSGITSPYDLKGKTIMYQQSVDDASLQALLQMFGLTENDYNYQPHNFDDWALTNSNVNVMSAYRSDQPFLYKQKGIEVNLLDPASYGIDFYGDLIFTTEARVKNDLEGVKRFAEASRKGWQYALDNQREIAELIINKYNTKLTLAKLLEEARVTESLIKPKLAPIGNVFPERFERISQTYISLGMVPKGTSAKGLLLQDYEEEMYQVDSRLVYMGLTLILLVTGYTLTQVRFNKRLQQQVDKQTFELEQNNEQLTQRNDQLVSQKQQVEEARAEAEAANNSKTLFLANMSHEIRTPMNGVLGTLQLLKKMPQTDEAKDLLNKALFSSKTLLTIIDDILDLSKIEANKLELESSDFNLDELVEAVVSSLQIEVDRKKLSLNVIKGQSYHKGWLGDEVRVKQILLNICSNAVKFTSQGKVNIKLDTDSHQALVIKVTDTGIGMSKEMLTRLFSRFEQADKSTTRQFGGTGLGMAISQTLAELMKGSISVESTLEQGSTFTICLPLEQVELAKITNKNESTDAPDLSGKTILLAEDNQINQAIFSSMMKSTNATLVITHNGQEAIDKMGENNIDLVFMDIQMPVMDGIEACKIIKQLYPNTPIIALTANVMDNDIKHYLQVGFDKHLGKPIDLKEIYEVSGDYLDE